MGYIFEAHLGHFLIEVILEITKDEHATTFVFVINPLAVQDNIVITELEISHESFRENGNDMDIVEEVLTPKTQVSAM